MVTHAKFWRWLVTLLAGIMVTQVVVTSMTSAQVAGAVSGRDLSTLIADHTILDSVKVSFKDANDNEISPDQVTNHTKMQFTYNWHLPDDLVKVGDFFTFKLPDVCKVTKPHNGELLDEKSGAIIADVVVSPGGNVTITFTDKVENLYGVKGTFYAYSDEMQFAKLGNQTIEVPKVRDVNAKVNLTVVPNERVDIAKSPGRFDQDTGIITWKIGVDANSLSMNNAVITENLPDTLKLSDVSIQKATVTPDVSAGNADGWQGNGQQLIEGTDYQVIGNEIHFNGLNTSPLLITVKTALAHPEQAIQSAEIRNDVSLTWDGHDYPGTPPDAGNTVQINNYTQKKTLQKKFVGMQNQDPYRYQWKVQYNWEGATLPAGTTLTDTLGAGQSFIQNEAGSFSLSKSSYSPGNPEMYQGDPLKLGVDYDVTYSGDQMIVTLRKDIQRPLVMTYDVHVADPKNAEVLKNSISDNQGHHDEAEGEIKITPEVKKTFVASSMPEHYIDYQVDLNSNQLPLNDLVLTDTMSSWPYTNTADLVPTTLKLVDQSTNHELTVGTDYLVETSANQFKVKLIGNYAKTTAHFVMTYRVTLDPNAGPETMWTNTLIGPNIYATVDRPPDPSDPGTNPPTTTTDTPPEKTAIWEETDNFLRWDILVNQKKETLNGATVTDHIEANQNFASVSLYVANAVNKKGYPDSAKVSEQDYQVDLAQDRRSVVVHLPENAKETYMVVVRTTRVDPLTPQAYSDTAFYDHGGITEKTNTPKIEPSHEGNLIQKAGAKDPDADNKADWHIDVNLAQAHLTNTVVDDYASGNQRIDPDQIVIHPITYDEGHYNGAEYYVDESVSLTKDVDYTITSTVDNETGETVLKINFLHDLDRAYRIQYSSTLIGLKADVSNRARITADEVTEDQSTTVIKVPLEGIGGTGSGEVGTYQVQKTNPSGEQLSGAEFALTAEETGLTRTMTTNDQGMATLVNLNSGTYYLKETKAPAGYQIAPEYQGQGKKITITFTGDQPTRTDTVVNEKAILPHTGGWQRAVALLIGMMLLALAGWLIVVRMKKAGDMR